MDDRQALDARAAGIMTVLCLIWGMQQVLLKMAAPDITPLAQVALRSGLSAALVWLFMRWRRQAIVLTDVHARAGLAVALLFGVEFILLGEALRLTSASHAAVLLYTAPIFAALGLHWRLPQERLAPLQWLGIGVAFAGVGITFLGGSAAQPAARSSPTLAGDLLALLAGAAWGATTVTVRASSLARAPAAQTLLYQLLGAFVLGSLAMLVFGQTAMRLTAFSVGNVLLQAVVVSFASYLVWFWLLKTYLASRLGVFSFLTPLFGIVFGVALLGERLTTGFVLGTGLVLLGVVLVSSHGWLRARQGV